MINYNRLAMEIYNLILRYVRRNKSLDAEFINEFRDYVISALDLKDYVSYKCKRIYSHQLAEYQYANHETTIDLFKVQNFAEKFKANNYVPNPLYISYAQTSKLLLHEATHAKQYKDVLANKNDLETKIMKAALQYATNPENADQKYQLYLKYYDLAPEERLAENFANSVIIQVLTLLGEDYQNLTFYYLKKLLSNCLRGYRITSNPTKTYLEALDTSHVLSKSELEGTNLPFKTRVKLGLEISEEERDNLIAKRLELTNKLQK